MTKTICSDEEQKEEEKVVVSVLISPKGDDGGHVFELELAPEKQEIVEPEPNNVVQAKEDTGIVAAAAITTRKILLLEKMPTTPSTTTVVVATTSVETIMPKCTTTTTSKQQQHSQPQPPPPPNHFLGRTSWMRKWRRLPPPRTTATDPRQPKYRPDRLQSHCRMEMAENGLGASSASYFLSRTTTKVNPEKHVLYGTTWGTTTTTTTTTTMSRKPKLQAVIIPGMKSIGRGISVVDPVPRRLPRSRSWRGSQRSLQISSNDKNNHDDRTHPRHQGGREIVPTTTRRSCLARNHGREKSNFSPSSPFVAAKRVRFLSTPFIQEFETESADTTTTTTTATDENDDDDEDDDDDDDDDDEEEEEEEDNLPLEHLGPPDWQDESSSGVVIQVEEEEEEENGTTTFIKRRQKQTTLVFDEQGGGGRGNNDTYAIVPMGHDHALLVAAEHDEERGEEEEEDTIMFNHHQDMLPRNRSSPTLAASYMATVGMGPDESSCDSVEVEEKQVAAANAAVTRSFCGIMTAATTAATTVSTAHSWNFMDCATIGPCSTFTNYYSS